LNDFDYVAVKSIPEAVEKLVNAGSGARVLAGGTDLIVQLRVGKVRPSLLVDIKGIRVDAEFGKSMIYVTNEDKPGFIGKFAGLLGDAKLNIATFHLGRNKPGGDAIALVEVDGAVPADVLAQVQALPQVKQAKALVF